MKKSTLILTLIVLLGIGYVLMVLAGPGGDNDEDETSSKVQRHSLHRATS